jgi:succinyl-CoA synthetase alpha subunit
MATLADKDTRVLIQGITGYEGSFHARKMIEYGTKVVGGVTPCKGGEWLDDKPIFDSVKAAVAATGAEASVIFVPPTSATDAILEAVDAEIPLIVCITDGIPVQDMMKVYEYVGRSKSRLLGPNCPGLLIPGQTKIGTMPGDIAIPGNIAVISKSGALTYEVVQALTNAGMGQSICVGIGGDPIVGTSFIDLLHMFENDPKTEKIVVLGEIGGSAEMGAAQYIKAHMTKPVAAFIAGKSAPEETRMGHAGAIVEGGEGTVAEKIMALKEGGVRVAEIPDEIPSLLKE